MRVRVESTVGLATPVEVEVKPEESVRELRHKVAAMQACDANTIALEYKGKVLEDSRRIGDYGIKEGDTIRVVPRHREGGFLPSSFLKNRISLESQLIRKEGIDLYPVTPYVWRGVIKGRGKWKGKYYRITIRLPREYPYRPPIVRRETPMVPEHPNIFPSGKVCLNILKDD